MAIVEDLGATGDAGRRRMRVLHPTTRAPLGEFDCANAGDVKAAIAKARAAQRLWAEVPFKERSAVMDRALGVLLERADEFVSVVMGETGRSEMETFFMEIFATADSINYWSRRAKRILRDRTVGLHLLRMKKARVIYKPLGVVGVITPWNGPFVLSLNPVVQALMAGNAAIVKPSEVTPFSGRLVQELFDAAGLPEGLVQVLLGDGDTGAALVEGGVDKIHFTGSVNVGRKIGAACGRQLIGCTLELGGKDPMIVCADADLERAAAGAVFGAFMNGGQVCSATERIFVVEEVADRFTELVVERVEALRLGGVPPLSPRAPGADSQGEVAEFDIGPFILDRQIETVIRQVDDAVARGADVLCGGAKADRPGFYTPTVLAGCTPDMLVMSEETFGPVLPIVRCATEDEAIEQANASAFGLGAMLWTKDKKRGERLARRIQAGSVVINDTAAITYGALELPFGGVKSSGVGRSHGESGLKSFCHAQPILTDRFGFKEEQIWFPYTAKKLAGLKKALNVIWGSPLKRLMK